MIQAFDYNNTAIEFELIDGELYANATAMCLVKKKRPAAWLQNESTKRYIAALKAKSGILTSLIISRKGGTDAGGTTWIHEKLILKLASWLDVDFEVWCDEKVAELLRTGTATLDISPLSGSDADPLLTFTQRPKQIANSKEVNSFNFSQGGKQQAIDYNRANCFHHTGKTPQEILLWAKSKGIPSRHRTSAKEVIRTFKPAVASSMALADDFCKTGRISIDEASIICKAHALPLFQKMQELGITTPPATVPQLKQAR
ncbi:KilA-N domain-containing protein [Spirosoma sordidisoli]|uniref:KilA-N domain-containing protein n=1 Tax=Spirosoma sordidisoli TaxID=2502893 RepID=A0A4Q2UN33_9BACT|nr:KilA-N domain-containing protein [Spirosoma sordidisoli]RYC70726.1 KilA-N domain-containing protein [Spirosoma sordidisoli]